MTFGVDHRLCGLHRLRNDIGELDRFQSQLDQAVARAQRHHEKLAVLFLDLDGFKLVNDTHGHAVGDGLLREVARRLTGVFRAEDTVARLGGDEFVIGLDHADSREDVGAVAAKIIELLGRPYTLDGRVAHVTVSVGASMYPADGTSPEVLMEAADQALYESKRLGKNRVSFFSADAKLQPAGETG